MIAFLCCAYIIIVYTQKSISSDGDIVELLFSIDFMCTVGKKSPIIVRYYYSKEIIM